MYDPDSNYDWSSDDECSECGSLLDEHNECPECPDPSPLRGVVILGS